MKVGDLVKSKHTGELLIITAIAHCGYFEVSSKWLMPEEHLEVISESRRFS